MVKKVPRYGSGKGGKKMNRGAWTAEEDQKLVEYVRVHGEKKWRTLPTKAELNRCGKSCRLRWLNYLRPGIKRGNISEDEEDLIIRLHNLLGNRWSIIAGRLPGRTDNEIKNHWNTHLSKKTMTIDDLNIKMNQSLDGSHEHTQQSSIILDELSQDSAYTEPKEPGIEMSELEFDIENLFDDFMSVPYVNQNYNGTQNNGTNFELEDLSNVAQDARSQASDNGSLDSHLGIDSLEFAALDEFIW